MRASRHPSRLLDETAKLIGAERVTTRVQLEMPPQAMERLQRLKDSFEAVSYAEVVRIALRLLEGVVEEQERGAEFSFTRPNGEVVILKVFA